MAAQTSTFPSTLVHTIHTHAAPINALIFSYGPGSYLLTGSSDRQIHLSRTEVSSSNSTATSKPIQKYTSHGYAVLDISVTQDNTKFASSSADRSGPFFWDINLNDSTIRRFGSNSPSPHTSRITCLQFTADDTILASGSDDRSVRLWDVKSRDSRPLMVLDEAKDGITSLVCRNEEIITASTDGRVRSYDVRMGRCVVDVQPGPVTSLSLSNDGRVILISCLDGKIRLMDRENGNCLRTFPPLLDDETGWKEGDGNRYINTSLRIQNCLAVNDSLVVSGNEADGRVRGWDVASGKELGYVDVAQGVVSVVRWREGSEVENRKGVWAAGGVDGIAKVYS